MRMLTARVMFGRSVRYTLHSPASIIFGLVQPVLYLALFGPLLTKVAGGLHAGTTNTWAVLVPGLLVQQAVFSSIFVGIGILADSRSGALDRMRMSQADPIGLLAGRIARDVLVLFLQSLLLCAGGYVAGLRTSWAGLALAVALLMVVGLAVASFSYGLALRLRSEMAFAQLVNVVTLPVVLLSGVLLPMSLAPAWLARVSDANPLKHIVTGARDLVAGDITNGAVLIGAAVAVGLLVVGGWFGVRALRTIEA